MGKQDHPRYGSLRRIADQTDGRCHLCHEPADLACYGPTGTCGDDTVNVDHLEPQSFGGDDYRSNLRIAHAWCNSFRGTRNPEGVRMELVGSEDEPLSRTENVVVAGLGGLCVAGIAGSVFGTEDERGERRFNATAALLSGVLAFAVLRGW